MKKFILILFFFKLLLKILLLGFDYYGDNSPETIEKILRYFSEENIQSGITYARAGFPFYFGYAVLKDLFVLWFLWTGFSLLLEDYCNQISGTSKLYRNTLFFSIIYFFSYIAGLPLSYYSGFYLEHEFGFSNMSLGFWVWTEVKSLLISFPIYILSSIVVLWIIDEFKKFWFLIVPVGGLVMGIFMTLLYPILILPIFYQVAPIEEGSLKQQIELLAKKTKINFSEINIIQESEYSKHTNAFFTGFGDQKKIYLYDTLIKNHTEKEVISVLAHEIGHWEFDHTLKGIVLSFFASFLMFWLLKIMYYALQKSNFPMKTISSPTNIFILMFLSKIFMFFISPIESVISRTMEASADWYALEMTEDPETFISTEVKMAKDNSSRLNPHPISSFFSASHPSTIERIEMAEKYIHNQK